MHSEIINLWIHASECVLLCIVNAIWKDNFFANLKIQVVWRLGLVLTTLIVATVIHFVQTVTMGGTSCK